MCVWGGVLKLFCIYHRSMPAIKVRGYIPIFAGNKVKSQQSKDGWTDEIALKKRIATSLADDAIDSDNISELNRHLNEMTAIYWIWKHYKDIGSPKFVGITHYRRFFAFNEGIPLEGRTWLPHSSTICRDTIEDATPFIDITYAEQYLAEGYSILTTRKYDTALLGEGDKSCRDRFCHIAAFDPALYDAMECLVLKAHPDYAHEVQALRDRASHYLFNMFVMQKEIFFNYCEFIFPILLELQKKVRTSDINLIRAPAFLAEFLTSMFISHQIRCNQVAIKELSTIYIDHPEYCDRMEHKKGVDYFKSAKDMPGKRLSIPQLIYLLFRSLNPFRLNKRSTKQ